MVSAVGDPIEAGREAVRLRAWEDAYELLSSAGDRLAAEDLRGLGEAAFWSGRPDEAVAARERAYKAYLDEGDPLRAADTALRLAFDYFPKGNLPLFRGWLASFTQRNGEVNVGNAATSTRHSTTITSSRS